MKITVKILQVTTEVTAQQRDLHHHSAVGKNLLSFVLFLSFIYPFPILYLSVSYPLSIRFLSFIYPFPILYLSVSYPFASHPSFSYPFSILCSSFYCTHICSPPYAHHPSLELKTEKEYTYPSLVNS